MRLTNLITAVDLHACGEPGRVITGGVLDVPGRTILLETGMLPMREPVTEFVLEAPAGLVGIRAECKDGKVTQVTFKNVPAFAVHLDVDAGWSVQSGRPHTRRHRMDYRHQSIRR